MKKTYDIRKVQTDQEMQDALQVRRLVFIDEQQVPEELEIDEHDERTASTVHFVAYDDLVPVGAGRIRPYSEATGKVERVAVLASQRGSGLGRTLMVQMEEEARQCGYSKLKLNAQCHAQPFYEKLGYQPVGEVFDEAGIDHIAMEKQID